jgi:hypothetical protein
MARKPIEWRIHVQASALAVFKALDTQSGRESFWAHSAPEVRPGVIEFCFAGGEWLQSQVLERREAHRWRFTYFNDSIVTIDLAPSPDGGTDRFVARQLRGLGVGADVSEGRCGFRRRPSQR